MTKEEFEVLQALVNDVSTRDVAMGRVVGLIVEHLVKLSPPPQETAPVEETTTPSQEGVNNGN